MKNLSPLSPHVEALLASHRRILPLAPAVAARALARAAAAAAESPESAVVRRPSPPLWMMAAAACVVLALGAGAYAARVWRVGPAAPGATSVAGSPVATKAPAPAAGTKVVKEAPATVAPRTVRHAAGKTSATGLRATPVPTNAELQLLRLARQDLTRGDFAGALAAVAEHERQFRHGSLVEEREALRVKSLAGLGRDDEAQRAAAQFHARFPHSVLLSTFGRMTESTR